MFRISLRERRLGRPMGQARAAGYRLPVPILRALGVIGLTLALLGLVGSRSGTTPAAASAVDRAVIIDGGYLGGAGVNDAIAIAVDSKGNAYVAGISADETPTPVPTPTATIDPAPSPSVNHIAVISKSYCIGDFVDQFDDPLSGWKVTDTSFLKSEYVGGEFRLVSKQSGFLYFINAPTCARFNYVVETTARWVGTPGSSYGVRFGISDDFSHYYYFDMNTDFQLYRVRRRTPAGFVTVVPVTFSPAIAKGNGSNSIKVTRNGTAITVQVGSTVLGTWHDSSILGLTRAGVLFSPYGSNPVADVRFDNFKVTTIFGGAEQTTLGGIASGATPGSSVPSDREFAPADLSWEQPELNGPSE